MSLYIIRCLSTEKWLYLYELYEYFMNRSHTVWVENMCLTLINVYLQQNKFTLKKLIFSDEN